MDVEVDHYAVLGLPSGEEGSRLSVTEIKKAYNAKLLELHPDKRQDDPNAHAGFLKLQTSNEVLKDKKARKLFDDLLRRKKLQREGQLDSRRRALRSDLERRERATFAVDERVKARQVERIGRELQEEAARIRAMCANKKEAASTQGANETNQMDGQGSSPAVFGPERRESEGPHLSNVVGAGFQAYEDATLEKLKQAAQRQKLPIVGI